jgi:L-asparagine oxygenase
MKREHNMICRELPLDFSFTDAERSALVQRLESIRVNPYKAYEAFRHEIRMLVASDPNVGRFRDFMEGRRRVSAYERPFVFIDNCPIDSVLPELGNADPVADKHAKKRSFVAEGFLQLHAEVAGEHPISYLNVNDGDVFQDIFPKESLGASQSQKALGPIHFHKDLANHFVRPDLVNILALRSCDDNEIWTTFVANRDVLAALDKNTLAVLREGAFYTPYDDLSMMGGNVALGKAADHAVLTREVELRFFENRTEGLTDSATRAVKRLTETLHAVKRRVQMRPGDFVSISNNLSLHGKEIGTVRNEAAQRQRWSIKTVNVHAIAPHVRHLVPGSSYLING